MNVHPDRSSYRTNRTGHRIGTQTASPAGSVLTSTLIASMTASSRINMRNGSEKSGQRSGASRKESAADLTLVGARVCRFLRQAHPARTADNVSADLRRFGVKSSTISKMLERESTPSAQLFIALFYVYGLEFLCAVLPAPPAWMVAAHRAEQQAALAQKIADLEAQLERMK